MQDLFSTSTAEFYPPDAGQEQLDQIAAVQRETEQKIAALRQRANDGQEDAVAELDALVDASNERVQQLQAERAEAREKAKQVVAFKTASARQAMIKVGAEFEVNEWYKQQARNLWQAENGPDAEPTDEELSQVEIPRHVFVEFQLRLVCASLGAGVNPAACQNLDLPQSVDDWLDLPEDVFNACCDACWRCNPSWRPGWQGGGVLPGDPAKNV